MHFSFTCDIVASLTEVHLFIKNLIDHGEPLNKVNFLYTNPFSETISFHRSEVIPGDLHKYKQVGINKNKHTEEEICEELVNPIIFKINFPFEDHDCYLGSIIISQL